MRLMVFSPSGRKILRELQEGEGEVEAGRVAGSDSDDFEDYEDAWIP